MEPDPIHEKRLNPQTDLTSKPKTGYKGEGRLHPFEGEGGGEGGSRPQFLFFACNLYLGYIFIIWIFFWVKWALPF